MIAPLPLAAPSFREIFRAFSPFVWRTVRRLGIAPGDVEDVSQEVFVVVHRKLPSFEARSSLRTWVYGICVRTASDHRKRAYLRHERPMDELPEVARSAPQDQDLDRARALDALDASLAGLDHDKRAVFVLFEIEELPMIEVAEAVGCPVQTAYARLYAARKHVESTMKRSLAGGSR